MALIAALCAMAFAGAPAMTAAQDLGHGPETVTVTARKHAESLQAVPATVSAIGSHEIERFRYDKPEDVVSLVPALTIQVGGPGSGGQISLRGVGSSSTSAAFDSAVALDFDGVQISAMRILQFGFLDMRQIEVLKGPQSLYFGKGASAGVLSFQSADPTDTWVFGGRAAYEFEERGYTLSAYASGPVTGTLGFRLAAQFNDVDKLYRNSAPGVAKPVRGERNANVRATFQLDPSDRFSANLKLNYVRYENDGALRYIVQDCGPNGVADPLVLLSGARIPAGYSCDTSGKTYFLPDAAPPLALQAPEGIDNKGGASFGRSQIWFGRLKMDWELTDALTLSSVSGYLDMTAHEQEQYSFGGLLGGVGFGLGAGLPTHRLSQFSQEVRLTSDFGGRADFMLGAFYETRDIRFSSAQQLVGISLLGRDPVTGNSFDWYKDYLTDSEAVSVFGSADLRITDVLVLTGGVRWTRETKVATFSLPYVHRFLSANPAFVASGFESGPIHFDDSNLSPEVTLSYRPAYNLNVYAAFKTGFKSGGIDNTAVPSATLRGFNSPDPAVRAATAATFVFDSETARGGETGVKSQWLDGALTLNGSIYYYVFKNLQVQNFNALITQFVTTNASELTTAGADLDFRWATPVEGLSLFGSLAYTRAKYTKPFLTDPINNPSLDIEGRRSARAPRWAGNIAADLRRPLSNALEFGLTGNLRFSGAYFTNEDTLSDHIQNAFVTLDLTASVADLGGRWQLAVVGSNLTDERSVNTSGPRPFLSRQGDDQIFDLSRGRQVSLEASFRF